MLNLSSLRLDRKSLISSKRKHGLKKSKFGKLEKLEPRHLLTANVIISEVLSANDEGIEDEDGESSDWLELYNAGHSEADLSGWYLTDTLEDRTKWQLPETKIGPGESLLIFASGKDRADGAELHTNFRISRGGEYLGLYQPDGRTAVYEFNDVPEQYVDVSYGTSQTLTDRTFVGRGDNAKVLLPGSAGDDVAVATWTAPDFDDAAWATNNNQLGFDTDTIDGDFNPLIDENGQLNMQGQASSAYIRSAFEIAGDAVPTFESLSLDINYDDGFVAYLNGSEVLAVNAPDQRAWNSVATGSNGGIADAFGYVDFSDDASKAEFTTLGDAAFDNAILRLTSPTPDQNSAVWRTEPVQFGPDYTFSTSMVFDIHSPGGGLANGDNDGIGGEGVTFVLQSNDNNVLGTGGKSLGLENTGSTFVAIELDAGETGAFDPNEGLPSHVGVVTNEAGNVARAGITRFNGNAFFEGQPGPGSNFNYLWVDYTGETQTLDVYHSFESTKPDAPTLTTTIDLTELFGGDPALYAGWTSTTTGAFNGHDLLSFDMITGVGELGREPQTFDLTEHIDKLQPGTNVLAFHGLNLSAADEDFLLIPQLTGKEVTLSEDVAFFNTPTPGTLNGEAGLPPSGGVTISHPSGIFKDPFSVTISADNADAVIRYTLDGKLPVEDSPIYEGPISVADSVRIRARAFEPNRSGGSVTTVGYTEASEQLVNYENGNAFQSNIPIMVFDSFGNRRVNSDARNLSPTIGVFIDPGEDGVASIFDEPDYAGRAGLRIRGQSSQGWAKKQYAVEIIGEDLVDDSRSSPASSLTDKSIPLFGLPAESDWVLNGPYSDKTQLNNYLTFNWYREIGLYAPRTKLVEVFVNDRGDDLDFDTDYRGTYVLLEKIKIDENRVDITRVEPSASEEPAINGGYIWKKDKDGAGDINIRTGRQTVKMVDPARGEITDAQIEWLDNHITEFEDVLYGDNFRDPNEGYAKYIDVDSWIDTWIMVEMTKNIDGFRLSTYYNKDINGKIKQGPAWDYNLSLANGNYLRGAFPDGWYNDGIDNNQYPYWDRLFEDPAFQQKLEERWTELRNSVFSTENLHADIDAAVNLISNGNPNLDNPAAGEPSNPISRNYERWTTGGYGTGVYHWPNCFFGQGSCPTSPLPGRAQPRTYGDHIFIMKWFVEERTAWMDEQLRAPIVATPTPGPIEAGTQVSFVGPAGAQLYYTTDGTDPDEPLLITETENLIGAGNAVSYHVPTSSTLIDACEGFRPDDPDLCFINREYNEGANGEIWKQGTLGLGFDAGAAFDDFISTDIGADANGANSVYLRIPFEVSERQGQIVENLKLDVQYDDGFAAYIWQRSLRSPNEAARSNAPGTGRKFPIRPLVFDAAATADRSDADAVGFETFDISSVKNNLEPGTNYLVIQLLNSDANMDDLLFDVRLNMEWIREEINPDVIRYEGPITVNDSTEFFVRGFNENDGSWTKGLRARYTIGVPEVAVTEINYNPYPPTAAELEAFPALTSNDFEFIEIKNIGQTESSLAGMRFENGLDYVFGDVSIPAGGYGLLVKNEAAFELRYGDQLNILGQYSSSLSDAGERISLHNIGGELITEFSYDDNDLFSEAADGAGATLYPIDLTADLDKYYNWTHSTEFGGSPGRESASPIGVAINEVLANSGNQPDAIELINLTSDPVDIGGWYLSDQAADLQKYQFAAGTTLEANSRLVVTEAEFNNAANPGAFALDGSDGDDVWLTIPDGNGGIASFVDDVHFRGSFVGESYARIPEGTGRLAPAVTSIGQPNTDPRVGPVIISEVNYNPGAPSEAALAIYPELTEGDLEFIEIHNPTALAVDTTDWRIRGGADRKLWRRCFDRTQRDGRVLKFQSRKAG